MRLNKKISDDVYKHVYPSTAIIPQFYCLPKIHKNNTPGRPIVSTINSPVYLLSKFIAKIIAPIIGKSETNVRNSASFCEWLLNTKCPTGYSQVSYDVDSLYTSVPVNDAIEAFRMQCEEYDVEMLSGISIDSIIEMIEMCTDFNFFHYNGQIYKQANGFPMGGCLSGPLCNIFLERLENQIILGNPKSIKAWRRYVDDIYCIVKTDDIDNILSQLNSAHPNIKFTTEIENNNDINFLDISIHKNRNNTFNTKVYRKPTHSGNYINFNSFHQKSQKTNVIFTLVHRATRLCSTKVNLKKEIEIITGELQKCDFPLKLIQHNINLALSKFSNPISSNPDDNVSNTDDNKRTMVIPYLGSVTGNLAREFNKYNIQVISKPGQRVGQLLNKHKFKISNHDRSDIIYKIPCNNCEKSYIGETSKKLKDRIKQHQGTIKRQDNRYAIYNHSKIGHEFNWDNATVLATNKYQNKRRWIEATHILCNKVIDGNTAFRPAHDSWLPLIYNSRPTHQVPHIPILSQSISVHHNTPVSKRTRSKV